MTARLPDMDTLFVRARLFDVDDGRLKAGQHVRARLDAFPDKVYGGRVREVGVYSEIHPWDMSDADIRDFGASGVVLSGGPESVNLDDPPFDFLTGTCNKSDIHPAVKTAVGN